MNWHLFIGSMVYIMLGGLFYFIIVPAYINQLCADVEMVNAKYLKKMRFTIVASGRKRRMLETLLFTVWPATCIAVILKAEYNYDSIIRRSIYRA